MSSDNTSILGKRSAETAKTGCSLCNVITTGEQQWLNHINSRKHRHNVAHQPRGVGSHLHDPIPPAPLNQSPADHLAAKQSITVLLSSMYGAQFVDLTIQAMFETREEPFPGYKEFRAETIQHAVSLQQFLIELNKQPSAIPRMSRVARERLASRQALHQQLSANDLAVLQWDVLFRKLDETILSSNMELRRIVASQFATFGLASFLLSCEDHTRHQICEEIWMESFHPWSPVHFTVHVPDRAEAVPVDLEQISASNVAHLPDPNAPRIRPRSQSDPTAATSDQLRYLPSHCHCMNSNEFSFPRYLMNIIRRVVRRDRDVATTDEINDLINELGYADDGLDEDEDDGDDEDDY